MSTNATPNGSVKILIVEDSPTQALLLESLLTKHGYPVVVAHHGRHALEILETFQPTVIITDIQMPVMDGYELCRAIKTDPKRASIPVILLTSLSAPQDIIRGLECGADNFVVKPYEESFLLSRLETVLANRHLETADDSRGIPIHFAGERYVVASDRLQILNLLLSTYETAVNTNLALVRAQEALKAAQDQLIEAEKLQSVGRLAAGVAHEVKNPLAIMEMGIELLSAQQSPDNEPILAELREAVKRANHVITGLMELSSPDEMGMQQVSMDALIERSITSLEKEMELAHIEVATDYAADLPLCRADVSKIDQVFRNVLSNAIQAMPKGGSLAVKTFARALGAADVSYDSGDRSGVRFREGDRAVIVEVRDSGAGIAPQNLSKLFEPFFSTKPTGTGMGLGLTVARKFMELHGGRIALRNHEPGGAVVTMMFRPV
ncbi:MAG: hypothetical protein QOE70_4708 [Chthoniobacter sp.]|jgi:signal transduction histidine kinase|nr:hypothetical protein [Chthoniobacter sp.]